MSPLPFRTLTGMRHGGGRMALGPPCVGLVPDRGIRSSVANTATAITTPPTTSSRGSGLRSIGCGGTGRPASSRASRLSNPSAVAYRAVAISASSGFGKRYTRPSSSQRTSSGVMPARRAVSSTVSCRWRRARASGDSSPVGSRGWTSSMLDLILVSGAAILLLPGQVIGKIDVSWRFEIVAGHELSGQPAQPLVRHGAPDLAGEQQRMKADAAVGRRQPLRAALAPCRYYPVDRTRIERRPVAQDDDRRLDLVAERRETASERRARPALPVWAAHDSFTCLA